MGPAMRTTHPAQACQEGIRGPLTQRKVSRLCDNGRMSPVHSTRAVRGLVAAGLATFIALFSHVIGGGAMPGLLGIVVPLVFSVFVCVLLAGRRMSLPRLTLSVTVSQFLFHTLFMLGTAQGVASIPAMSGHASHEMPILPEAAAMPIEHGAHTGAGMWVAHGVAGLITVAMIHWAGKLIAAVASVKELVLARLVPNAPTVVAAPTWLARVPLLGKEPSPRPLGIYPATMALRGPPARFCF